MICLTLSDDDRSDHDRHYEHVDCCRSFRFRRFLGFIISQRVLNHDCYQNQDRFGFGFGFGFKRSLNFERNSDGCRSFGRRYPRRSTCWDEEEKGYASSWTEEGDGS